MIVVFDLDDTLYEEMSYVRSGFDAVAREVAERWNVDFEEARRVLDTSLQNDGRGTQFNQLCRHFDKPEKKWLAHLIKTYRHHEPSIQLPDWGRRVLDALSSHRLYLVTDGHKIVQQKKLTALGIESRFLHCFLTNRYGVQNQKPSPLVFERIVERERCQPGDVVYIGDNPNKDFCGIRPRGFRTIRVRRGHHAAVEVPAALDAEVSVTELEEILPIIAQWERADDG